MQVPYIYVKTDDEILGALQEFVRAPLIATDTETTGLDPHTDQLLLWQFSNGQKNIVINCITENAISRKDETSPVYRLLKDICVKKDYLKMGHNIGFDFKMIKKHLGFEMTNLYDTMIAEKVLIAGKDVPSNRYQPLKVVAPKYANLTERDMKKEIRAGFYSGYVLNDFTEDQLEYSARDVQVLHPIYWGQVHQIQQDGLDRVAQLEFDIIPAVAMMEYHGVNMDVPYWRGLLAEAEQRMIELRKEIQFYLKPLAKQKSIFDEFCEISIDSPTQLAVALRDLGLNVESTGADILEKISGSHPILKPLLDYREHNKFYSTYGNKLLARINPKTGKIHPSFSQCSPASGRFSSNNPNAQNIPAKQKFRKGFVAPEGYLMLGADFSGQELRMLAFLANETNMLDAFRRGEDIHNNTTCLVHGIKSADLKKILSDLDKKLEEQRFDEVTKEEEEWKHRRGVCKSTNFLCSYGGSYRRLSDVANILEDEAKSVINSFFKAYPALKKYIDIEGKKAVERGYSTTVMGRRRYYTLPPTSDPDYQKIAAAVKRQSVNHGIQGSCASMTKIAIKLVKERFTERFGYDNAYLALAVHDELQTIVRKDNIEEAKEILSGCMRDAFEALIPPEICECKTDVKFGPHWIH
jgi:DNA polymerase I